MFIANDRAVKTVKCLLCPCIGGCYRDPSYEQAEVWQRLYVAGWDRKQAAAATGAARAELAKYSKYHYNEDGTIVVTDDWKGLKHPSLPAEYKPYAVVETVSQNGAKEQRNRTIYGPDARQSLQVHGGPHGNPKKHPFGKHGEHVHRIVWKDDVIVSRKADELNDREKKEHKDII